MGLCDTRGMTLHRRHKSYSTIYAKRKLAAAQAAYASWDATVPRDWRGRADRHQALQKWGSEVERWRAVLNPPPVEKLYILPF